MAGLGRKTWSPGDTLTAADVNGYLMDQSVMVFAGTAARASAIPSPSAGMVAYSTATSLQVYNGSAWVDLSTGYGVATGGASTAVTVGGINYTLLTFTTDGNLVVSKAGLFDCLLFGGGAGGMQYTSGAAGGGGAGGYFTETIYLDAATYTVDVGAGGATSQLYSSGAVSSIGAIPNAVTAAGGCGFQLSGGEAVNFGIGCGNGSLFTTGNLTVSNIQGFKGGGAAGGGGVGGGGGGGGGVTQAGFQGVNGTTGGAGGAGYDVSAFIGGSALYKGGGGGGGGSVTGGAGGSSVGGAGGSGGAGSAAAANTASGGGGGGGGAVGGAGGSGIIYVRFKV